MRLGVIARCAAPERSESETAARERVASDAAFRQQHRERGLIQAGVNACDEQRIRSHGMIHRISWK